MSEPPCVHGDGRRCGPLGHWDSATTTTDPRQLEVHFTGFCGGGEYAARVQESKTEVRVYLYGVQPYSNLCASGRQVTVHLAEPLGSRMLLDGRDGHRRPLTRP